MVRGGVSVSALDRGQGVGLLMIHEAGTEMSHVAISGVSAPNTEDTNIQTPGWTYIWQTRRPEQLEQNERAAWFEMKSEMMQQVRKDRLGETDIKCGIQRTTTMVMMKTTMITTVMIQAAGIRWACAGRYATRLTGTRILNSVIETAPILPHFTDGEGEVQQDLCS